MVASNHIVIQSYETKIEELEQQKALVAETLHHQPQKPDSFEDKPEPVLTFLANPWKLWETGHIHARRLVAKLAFAERVVYDRKLGARTPEIALQFKAFGSVYTLQKKSGAVEKTRTSTGVTPQRPQRCASTNSATTALSRLGEGLCSEAVRGSEEENEGGGEFFSASPESCCDREVCPPARPRQRLIP